MNTIFKVPFSEIQMEFDNDLVWMENLLEAEVLRRSGMELPFYIGKKDKHVLFADLVDCPHLLIGGSNCLSEWMVPSNILFCLYCARKAKDLKLITIASKSEHTDFEMHMIGHEKDRSTGFAPVYSDGTDIAKTLMSVSTELDRRYEALNSLNANDVRQYNTLKKRTRMPYIAVFISGFRELTLKYGKEVEAGIARIAQKGQAVGVHLVVSNNRVTQKAFSSRIRKNFPTRIAFNVPTERQSRLLLDNDEATQICRGRGIWSDKERDTIEFKSSIIMV